MKKERLIELLSLCHKEFLKSKNIDKAIEKTLSIVDKSEYNYSSLSEKEEETEESIQIIDKYDIKELEVKPFEIVEEIEEYNNDNMTEIDENYTFAVSESFNFEGKNYALDYNSNWLFTNSRMIKVVGIKSGNSMRKLNKKEIEIADAKGIKH